MPLWAAMQYRALYRSKSSMRWGLLLESISCLMLYTGDTHKTGTFVPPGKPWYQCYCMLNYETNITFHFAAAAPLFYYERVHELRRAPELLIWAFYRRRCWWHDNTTHTVNTWFVGEITRRCAARLARLYRRLSFLLRLWLAFGRYLPLRAIATTLAAATTAFLAKGRLAFEVSNGAARGCAPKRHWCCLASQYWSAILLHFILILLLSSWPRVRVSYTYESHTAFESSQSSAHSRFAMRGISLTVIDRVAATAFGDFHDFAARKRGHIYKRSAASLWHAARVPISRHFERSPKIAFGYDYLTAFMIHCFLFARCFLTQHGIGRAALRYRELGQLDVVARIVSARWAVIGFMAPEDIKDVRKLAYATKDSICSFSGGFDFSNRIRRNDRGAVPRLPLPHAACSWRCRGCADVAGLLATPIRPHAGTSVVRLLLLFDFLSVQQWKIERKSI